MRNDESLLFCSDLLWNRRSPSFSFPSPVTNRESVRHWSLHLEVDCLVVGVLKVSEPVIEVHLSNCGLEGEVTWGSFPSSHGYNEKGLIFSYNFEDFTQGSSQEERGSLVHHDCIHPFLLTFSIDQHLSFTFFNT